MNRNRFARFWSRLHFMVFLTFAIVIALLAVKTIAIGLSVLPFSRSL